MKQILFLIACIGLLLFGGQNVHAKTYNLSKNSVSLIQTKQFPEIIDSHKTSFSLPDCTNSDTEEDFITEDTSDFSTVSSNYLRKLAAKNWNSDFYSTIKSIFIQNQLYSVPNFYGTSRPIYLVIRVFRI